MRIAPLVRSWIMEFQSDLHAKMTKIYYSYHNYPLAVMNKPNLRSLDWIENCFSLLFSLV